MIITEPKFFYAVVENRMDPLKLGRVQVRIVGIHTEQLALDDATGEGLESINLPWAHPASSITSASMNGIGETPLGPVEGTWVIGMTRDGDQYQDLVFFATLTGIPQEVASANVGFQDPNQKYPKQTHIKEPDLNRLARNESIEKTIVQKKLDTLTTSIPIALGSSWNEPNAPYNSQYPYNHVTESESGHITEIDDTPNNERIHEYHKSGTFKEVDHLGTQVTKVVKDKYSIILGNDYVEIVGNCNVHIGGNATLQVDGSVSQHVKGSVHTVTDGNATHDVKGNYLLQVGGTTTISSAGNFKTTAPRIDLN